MEIKKGDKFLCIKDVIMCSIFTEEVVYNEGNIYTSEQDGCITNNKGNTSHYWKGTVSFWHYFKPLKEVDKMYTKATEMNGLEEKSATKEEQKEIYDEDPYNWVNNGLQDISVKKTDDIVKSVIDKYQQRSEVGIKKYGTTLQDNTDGIETFLTHLQEEMMDATLYIEKLKRQFAKLKKDL